MYWKCKYMYCMFLIIFCIWRDQSLRPSAVQLLQHAFITKRKNSKGEKKWICTACCWLVHETVFFTGNTLHFHGISIMSCVERFYVPEVSYECCSKISIQSHFSVPVVLFTGTSHTEEVIVVFLFMILVHCCSGINFCSGLCSDLASFLIYGKRLKKTDLFLHNITRILYISSYIFCFFFLQWLH